MFIGDGIVELEVGSWIVRRILPFRLQQVFSAVILAIPWAMQWKTTF